MVVRFGFSLQGRGALADRETITALARQAEALGDDSIWVTDRLLIPVESRSAYPYSSTGAFPLGPDEPWLESLTAITYLATVTQRIAVDIAFVERRALIFDPQLRRIGDDGRHRLATLVFGPRLRRSSSVTHFTAPHATTKSEPTRRGERDDCPDRPLHARNTAVLPLKITSKQCFPPVKMRYSRRRWSDVPVTGGIRFSLEQPTTSSVRIN